MSEMGDEEDDVLVNNKLLGIMIIIFIIPILFLTFVLYALILIRLMTEFILHILVSVILSLSLPVLIPLLYFEEINNYIKLIKGEIKNKEIRLNNIAGILFLLLWFITMPFSIYLFFYEGNDGFIILISTSIFLTIFCFEMGYLKLKTAKKLKLRKRCESNG